MGAQKYMAKEDPIEKCSECEHEVMGRLVPGGGKPEYAPIIRFKCPCGNEWERVES